MRKGIHIVVQRLYDSDKALNDAIHAVFHLVSCNLSFVRLFG